MAKSILSKATRQLIKVVKELNILMDLLNINYISQAAPVSELRGKANLLYHRYNLILEIEYVKNNCSSSGYEDLPYKMVDETGYVLLYTKNYTLAISEHRYVLQKHIGRKLKSNELVHHKNMNTQNNDIENLQIMTAKEHCRHHAKMRASK